MADSSTSDLKQNSESVAKQVFAAVKEKDLSGLAKEVAYNILFSIAPLLIFITALAGLITRIVNSEQENPAEPVLKWVTDNLPADAANFLSEPINNALTTSPGFLLSIGGILALWGAKNAMSGVIKGLNVAYNVEKDERSFITQTLLSIGLTIAIAIMVGVAGFLFVIGSGIGEDLASGIGLGGAWTTVSTWLRWPVILVVVILAVAIIHRYGPNVDAQLRWFLPGAAFTVVAMVIATFALGIYFNISGGYNAAYGAFGAVLAFIFWLYVMSLLLLLGGVINMAVQKELPQPHQDVEQHDDRSNRNEDVLEGVGTDDSRKHKP